MESRVSSLNRDEGVQNETTFRCLESHLSSFTNLASFKRDWGFLAIISRIVFFFLIGGWVCEIPDGRLRNLPKFVARVLLRLDTITETVLINLLDRFFIDVAGVICLQLFWWQQYIHKSKRANPRGHCTEAASSNGRADRQLGAKYVSIHIK